MYKLYIKSYPTKENKYNKKNNYEIISINFSFFIIFRLFIQSNHTHKVLYEKITGNNHTKKT